MSSSDRLILPYRHISTPSGRPRSQRKPRSQSGSRSRSSKERNTPGRDPPASRATSSNRKRKRSGSRGTGRSERNWDDARNRSSPEPDPWTLGPPEEAQARMPPETAAQYKLAGLEFHQPLPRGRFPHSSFDYRDLGARNADSLPRRDLLQELSQLKPTPAGMTPNGNVNGRLGGSPSPKQKAVGSLLVIMYKSLLQKDYKRGSQAFGLLLRTKLEGQSIDIRRDGLWGVGADVLLHRNRAQPPQVRVPLRPFYKRKVKRGGSRNRRTLLTVHATSDDERIHAEKAKSRNERGAAFRREQRERPTFTEEDWGRAKEYFEALILQYPYQQQTRRPGRFSALEFYLVMYEIWIAQVQEQQRFEMEEIWPSYRAYTKDDHDDGHGDLWGRAPDPAMPNLEGITLEHQERLERLDQVLRRTYQRATAVAEDMQWRLSGFVYNDDHDLVRLRGMVENWLAGLCVPMQARLFVQKEEEQESSWWSERSVESAPESEEGQENSNGESSDGREGMPRQASSRFRALRDKHRSEAERLIARSKELEATEHLRIHM